METDKLYYQNVKAKKGRRILSDVILRPKESKEENGYKCKALWDTGADISAITQLAIDKLGLAPTGTTPVGGQGGRDDQTNVYEISIALMECLTNLSDGYTIPSLKVARYSNSYNKDGTLKDDYGILIGMDIIKLGDLCITNSGAETQLSFRIPPKRIINFQEDDQA